ncbi:MAG: cupredoxin family protein [Burkholderiaceae bacterium]|jgi:uncharacterized cupredoxin-like copper-binding protein|nr:cupredoxin family protein [Burkholderiaceae bacterium]
MNRIFDRLLVVALLATGSAALAHGSAHDRTQDSSRDSRGSSRAEPDTVATAFGRSGDPARVSRTITVRMHDRMRFDPAELTVRQGDTVRFVVVNAGRIMHELVLGTDDELRRHAALMRANPDMEHDAPYMVHVDPGKRGEFVWQFTEPGRFRYGCLVPGHFEAGMVGTVNVLPRRP